MDKKKNTDDKEPEFISSKEEKIDPLMGSDLNIEPEEEEDEEDSGMVWTIIENLVGKDGLVKLGDQLLRYHQDKNATQLKRDELRLASGEKNSHYFKTQYFQDMGMVAMVLVSILLLSYLELLETSTTGTLMGSIIGYALGQFRERYRPKS